ncbi:hypothetical protein KKG72_02745 [bacterium]|nr:hypothetical protein [bacterium]MBU1994249.1 hypothetical protein [bacterium]
MDFNGLSIDQAPPISAPLRFFLTAPVFGLIAGILILFTDVNSLQSRFSIESILIAHAITIGFFSFVMLGALTQMLPVLAGAKIPKVELVAKISHFLLVFGTLCLLSGLYTGNTLLTTFAFVGLGCGFLMMIIAIAYGIMKVKNFTPTVKAMATSLIFAFFVLLMGLVLLYSHIAKDISEFHLIISNIHSVWGIFGFAGILIIGVSFQVLPMFYVAPRFKQFCKQKVMWLIVFGLLLWLVSNIFYDAFAVIAKLWVALFFLAFATTVWKKLDARRRPISDVTVWYWRSSSVFLAMGTIMWVADEYFGNNYTVLVALFIGGGFIFSIMIGMLYKIIPFLVWFHLNGSGYMSIPTMNEMINKKLSYAQFIFFIVALIGLSLSFFIPALLEIFAFSFILSMIILQYNVAAPVLIYVKIKKMKPDFDMSAFTIHEGNK